MASKRIPNEHFAKIVCQACGKPFNQTHHAQKVCSVKCRAKYEAQLEKQRSDDEVARLADKIQARLQADIDKKRKDVPKSRVLRVDNMISPRIRFIVLSRDGFKCAYCGRSAYSDGVKLAVDHISPWSLTYDHSETNLITACDDCNSGKSNLELPPDVKKIIDAVVKERMAQDAGVWRAPTHGKSGDD